MTSCGLLLEKAATIRAIIKKKTENGENKAETAEKYFEVAAGGVALLEASLVS